MILRRWDSSPYGIPEDGDSGRARLQLKRRHEETQIERIQQRSQERKRVTVVSKDPIIKKAET